MDLPLGQVALIGTNDTPIWGMSNAERVRRMINEAAKNGSRIATGYVLAVNLRYVFDPLLLREALKTAGKAFTYHGDLLIGQIPEGSETSFATTTGVDVVEIGNGQKLYNDQLRKLEQPFAMPLTPQTRAEIERRSYYGAYKGVTDILTKYLWPQLAFLLTRIAARLKMTPNMVTGIGAFMCVLATYLFTQGFYWSGIAAGFVFMVLDTVDGKLARCTITSSKWGNVFDHGIDLIHPPFWWLAWGVGLGTWGLGLSSQTFWFVMGVIFIGYVAQRLVEGAFIKAFNGMHIHVWRPFDTWFRLITARRNPNMVILVVAMLFSRPDLGLIGIAWWTALSLLVHLVQLAQAYVARARGKVLQSWLEQV